MKLSSRSYWIVGIVEVILWCVAVFLMNYCNYVIGYERIVFYFGYYLGILAFFFGSFYFLIDFLQTAKRIFLFFFGGHTDDSTS